MVSIDCLAALDTLIWLGTGQRAAAQLGLSQPTISRCTRQCSAAFKIRVVKRGSHWEVRGNAALLEAERRVHQRLRWEHQGPLRFDGHAWMAEPLRGFAPADWHQGTLDHQSEQRPLALLRGGVLDGWLTPALTAPADPSLAAWQLARIRPDTATMISVHSLPGQHPDGPLIPLSIQPGVPALWLLVVPRRFATHPRTEALAEQLQEHLRHTCAGSEGIEMGNRPEPCHAPTATAPR